MCEVVTSRFNDETLQANYSYREKKNFPCMYCCPQKISAKIAYNTPVFVIEMNNSTNMIQGIGLIKNKSETTKYYKVHSDGNINRYTYIGQYFISRNILYELNSRLVHVLEEILFKGKTHSKRGSGLMLIPQKVLKFDICKDLDIKKEIKQIFTCHYKDNFKKCTDEEN